MDVGQGVLVTARRVGALLLAVALTLAAAVTLTGTVNVAAAPANALAPGFTDETLWSGLNSPTVVAFANNGAAFVAEKQGTILRFDSLTDTTGELVADLRAEVHNRLARGLLGLAVDPNFGPSRPYIYVLYTYDHILGDPSPAPRWGTETSSYDGCPDPLPGDETDGCVVSGRLSKLVLSSVTGTVASEEVLVEDWCNQFDHAIGTVTFGTDGMLYAGGGDGASHGLVDYGQFGGSPGSPTPVNPCGDPPTPIGTTPTPDAAMGGALRTQAAGTTARESTTGMISLDGTIIRVDPDSGLGVAGNPWFSKPGADANEQRVIAYGLRNPFRFSVRGGTNQIWVGDVGWHEWEEINVIPDATTLVEPLNYGWPCYEGNRRQLDYKRTNLGVCNDLYGAGASPVQKPFYTYSLQAHPVESDGCSLDDGSAIAGVANYGQPGGSDITPYPAKYHGALFFTDYTRKCIWAMLNGANGDPDPTKLEAFANLSGGAVDLVVGPDGNLVYTNFDAGEIRRIRYYPSITPGVATVTEGDAGTTTVSVPVTLSAPSPLTVTAQYQAIDGTATAPGDYTATSGTVTFAPGQTETTVEVPIVGDTVLEPTETLLVWFSAPTNATIGGFYGLGAVVIVDNDGGPVTTGWTLAEQPRVLQSATYLGQTPEQLQKTAVQFVTYLLAIANPKPAPAPVVPPPSSDGPVYYTTTWTTADVSALHTVEAQYALTAEQAQKYSVQLVGYLLALGGH